MRDVSTDDFLAAMGMFASGVAVVTVRDGRDDIGTTVTAFASVSLDPPMVLVSVAAESYLREVLTRRARWAVTVLAGHQVAVAGRFAAAGRPSARLLVASLPHHRGRHSEALVLDDGLAALECETRQRVAAGDHTVFLAEVIAIDHVRSGSPLLRFDRRYRSL